LDARRVTRSPGIDWPRGSSGGSLFGIWQEAADCRTFANQPDVLIAWLRDPPALVPGTAMPPSPLTDAQARDVAAYLYTLDDR
jgi:sulfur-oxidizing protein SoxX